MTSKATRNIKSIPFSQQCDIKLAARMSIQQDLHCRRFLFSSIPSEMEEPLKQKIESLNGQIVFHTERSFSSLYTHVIANNFISSEKILSALAGGKWLLTPNYVEDSYKKGYWLKEEDYEFTHFNKIATYHRCKRQLRKCGLYDGIKFLVVTEATTISRSFRRILTAGGAEIASIEDLTGVDFVITTKKCMKKAEAIVGDSDIPLLDSTYIKETLIFRQDPYDEKKFNLHHLQELETMEQSSTSSVEQVGRSLPQEPGTETVIAKKKLNYIKPKQTTETRMIDEPTPKKKHSEERQRGNSAENNNESVNNSGVSSYECNALPMTPVVHDVDSEPQKVIKRRKQNIYRGRTVSGFDTKRFDTKIESVDFTPSTRMTSCFVKLGEPLPYEFLLMKFVDLTKVKLSEPHLESEQFERSETRLKQSPRRGSFTNTPTEHLCREANPPNSPDCITDSSSESKSTMPSKKPLYSLTKLRIKEAMLSFIRSTNYLSEGCGANLLLPPISPHQPSTNEHKELAMTELHFYTSLIELRDPEMSVYALDILLDQVSVCLYPPPAILGSLLKEMVLETPCRIVHSRALRVLYKVLTCHRPHTTKMRKYYLRVFEKALQPNTSGKYMAWQFLQGVIECALNKDSDRSLPSPDTQAKVDGTTKALNLLEFFTTLIAEDVMDSPYGEAVQDLLTWDIFWDYSRICTVLPPPVKQLLQLWMCEQTSQPVRRYLSHFVSVLLVVMWKLSGDPLVPVTTLPDTLAAVKKEIGLLIKGMSKEQSVNVVVSLPNPWVQCVVSFIIVQEVIPCPKEIHLSTMVELFCSISKNTKNNAVVKPNFAEKFHNNLPVNEEEELPMPSRSPISKINKRNAKGETALLRACVKNDVVQVKHLLKEPGVDINLSDNCGWTPLHEAAIRGHCACIELILTHNAVNNKGTLHSHSQKGSGLPSSIYAGDFKEGIIPLHDAVRENKVESVKLLLEYGGEDLLKVRTKNGETAFDLATNEGMLRLLNMYKKKSADYISTCPSLKDQHYHQQLLLMLSNFYVEVSGFRFMTHTVKDHMCQIVKDKIKRNTKAKKNDMDNKGEVVSEKMNGEITKKPEPLHLNLMVNENLETMNELEEKIVDKICKNIMLDWKVQRNALVNVKNVDTRHLCRILWSE